MTFGTHEPDDLEALLALILKRAGLKTATLTASSLLDAAAASVNQFSDESNSGFRRGTARAALLKLWKAADKGSPKGALCAGLAEVPQGALLYLEGRASRVLPALGLEPVVKDGLLGWAEAASDDDLRTMILHCAAEGRQFAEGRTRPNGKQSRGRSEPVVLSVADRLTYSKQKNALSSDGEDRIQQPASNAGRSRIDDKVALILMLANDWYRATGFLQTGGRSEQNPFNEFVISVFEWAHISGAENALRAFWSEMKQRKARSAPDIGSPPK